jgi:hypothetical protein
MYCIIGMKFKESDICKVSVSGLSSDLNPACADIDGIHLLMKCLIFLVWVLYILLLGCVFLVSG